jgi:hypothetical protein
MLVFIQVLTVVVTPWTVRRVPSWLAKLPHGGISYIRGPISGWKIRVLRRRRTIGRVVNEKRKHAACLPGNPYAWNFDLSIYAPREMNPSGTETEMH